LISGREPKPEGAPELTGGWEEVGKYRHKKREKKKGEKNDRENKAVRAGQQGEVGKTNNYKEKR